MAAEGEGELKAGLTDLRAQVNDWSLATDDNLLVLLRKFSEHLINRVNAMDDELQGLVENTRNTEISVANTFNRFLMLRNSQFIENCVFNDSPEQEEMQSTTKPTPMTENEKHVAKFNKFKAALNKGMEAMALAPRIRQENSEEDVDQPPSLPNPRDTWNQRPLPFIIGTRKFQDDDNLGLLDYHDDPVYNEHIRKQDEPLPIEEEKISGAIEGDVVPAPNNEEASDEDKEDWSWLAPKISSVLATMDMKDEDDLLGLSAFQELFKGLDEERVAHLHRQLDENESGIIMVSDLVRFLKEHHRSADDFEREDSDEIAAQGDGPALLDILAKKFKNDQEDAKMWDEVENGDDGGPPPLPSKMKNKNKRKDTNRSAQHKALFGSDSEEEDGGMFSKKEDDVEHLLSQATMFVTDTNTDEKDDIFGDINNQDEDLFGNDEEEDLLFPRTSSKSKRKKSERKSKKKDKDLFGESDDEDIFGSASRKEKLIIDPSKLLPGAKRPSKRKSEADSEKAVVVKKGLKNDDLFGASDDEDDDFLAASRPVKKKANSVKKAPKANIFGSDSEEDDLFSTKTKKKESVGIDIFADASDDGDIFGGNAPTKKKPAQATTKVKPVKNDIFGDTDSDSEDLFGGSSKKKKVSRASVDKNKRESLDKKKPEEGKKPEKKRGSLNSKLMIDPSRLLPGSAATVKQIKRQNSNEDEKTVVDRKPTPSKPFESEDDDDLFAAKERASKKKNRRIFDSDSDDDIFAIKRNSIAPKKGGLFGSSSSDDDDFMITKKTKPKPKPGVEGKKKKKKLFDSSSEDEEELKKPAPVDTNEPVVEKKSTARTPAATSKTPKKSKTPKAAGNVIFDPSKLLPGSAKTVGQIKRQNAKAVEEKETITVVGKVTVDPLADDEDEDLFATKATDDNLFSSKPKATVVKDKVKEEDDDEFFSTKAKTSPKVSKLLDDEEEDDEDLFSTKPKKTGKSVAEEKTNKSDIFGSSDDDDDIFSIRPSKKKPEEKLVTEPVKESRQPQSESKADKWGASSEDDDDIFAVKRTVSPKKSSPKKKPVKNDIFGDSDDDDDLFASRKKSKPKAEIVKEVTPPHKSPTPPKENTPPVIVTTKIFREETAEEKTREPSPAASEEPSVLKMPPVKDEPPLERKESPPPESKESPPAPAAREPTPPKGSSQQDVSEGNDAEPASVLAFNRSVKVLKDDKPKKSRGKRKKQSSKIASLAGNIKIAAFAPGAKPPKKSSKISEAANKLNINPLTLRPGAARPIEEKKSDGKLEHVESTRPMQKGRRARSRRGKKRSKQPTPVIEHKAAPPRESKEDDIQIYIKSPSNEAPSSTTNNVEPIPAEPLGGSMTITTYDPLSSMSSARDPMASTISEAPPAESTNLPSKKKNLFADESKTRTKVEDVSDPFAMDDDDDLFGTKKDKKPYKKPARLSVDLFADSSPPPPKKTSESKREERKKPKKVIDLFGDSDEDIFSKGKKKAKRGPSLFGEEEDELFGGKKKSKKKKNKNIFDDDDDDDLFS